MKRIVLFTAILMATIVAKAQGEEGDFTIQPKVGINLSSLSDADKAIVEVNFGFEGEYMLTDNLSFAAGVIVSNQGAKYDSSSAGSYTADLDYANVPVVLNYYVLPGLAIKAGVQPGFRVKAKAKTDGASVDLDEMYGIISKATGEEVKINKFDLSIPVGISYEYKNIVLDVRYNWGLVKIANVGDAFYNRVLSINLGYKFNIEL